LAPQRIRQTFSPARAIRAAGQRCQRQRGRRLDGELEFLPQELLRFANARVGQQQRVGHMALHDASAGLIDRTWSALQFSISSTAEPSRRAEWQQSHAGEPADGVVQ
jgi:hypothetical protein